MRISVEGERDSRDLLQWGRERMLAEIAQAVTHSIFKDQRPLCERRICPIDKSPGLSQVPATTLKIYAEPGVITRYRESFSFYYPFRGQLSSNLELSNFGVRQVAVTVSTTSSGAPVEQSGVAI